MLNHAKCKLFYTQLTQNMSTLRQQIEEHAKSLGFDLVGFTKAQIEEKYLQAFDEWLAQNHEADMTYMQKIQQRRDLTNLLPGAKSVIVLGTNYYHEQSAPDPGHGTVARYAYGRDYHKIIKKKLKQLENFIKEIAPQAATRPYVDTGPIIERALAQQAGIGIMGKNSCLISREFGSWIFISEIITDLDLSEAKAPIKTLWQKMENSSQDFAVCGSCTKCIDACPTGAIIAPGVIDSRLCISYLTIENKGDISPELAKIIKDQKRLYGCDICQEVCPHNKARQKPHDHQEFKEPAIAGSQLSLKKVLALKDDQQFLETFAGSPLMRAKRKGLQRNARVLE